VYLSILYAFVKDGPRFKTGYWVKSDRVCQIMRSATEDMECYRRYGAAKSTKQLEGTVVGATEVLQIRQ
jgi:hypothetical protein